MNRPVPRLSIVAALIVVLASTVAAVNPSRVRIGVMGLFHSDELVVEPAPGQWIVVAAAGREFVLGGDTHRRVTLNRSGKDVRFDWAGAGVTANTVTFRGQHGDASFHLSVPGKLRRAYRGNLTIESDAQQLLAVVEMDLELAVSSIVAAESEPNTPLEALKAQAVASRSFLVASAPRHAHAGFCDTTHCQFLRNPPSPNSAASQAASATAGLILTWRGRPFAAMYSASCGGRTHTLAELELTAEAYPYYAVECSACQRSAGRPPTSPSARDAAALSATTERARIRLGRTLGEDAVPSDLTSANTDVTAIERTGHGHGIGLCQRGAVGMARNGRDFRSILTLYYPNALIRAIGTH